MNEKLPYHKETPSQTAGPYVHIGLTPNYLGTKGVYKHDLGSDLITKDTKGKPIQIEGYIYDGNGDPLLDAVMETWQADADGIYNSPEDKRKRKSGDFMGWGRVPTDFKSGLYRFRTIKPGKVPWPDGGTQAPHILLWIIARGINLGLNTRLYFGDEETANAKDPVLLKQPANRRAGLIAKKTKEGHYRFDIYLQGEKETVFFDI